MINLNNNNNNSPFESPKLTAKTGTSSNAGATAISKKTGTNDKMVVSPNAVPNSFVTLMIRTHIPNVFFNPMAQSIELSSLKGEIRKIHVEDLDSVSAVNHLALIHLGLNPEEIEIIQEDLLSPDQLKQLLYYYAKILSNYTIINDQLISHSSINTKLSPITLLKTIKIAITNMNNTQAESITMGNHKIVWQKDKDEKLLFHLLDTSKKLGAGTYGQVFSFIHINTGTENVAKVAMAGSEKDILNETEIYAHLYKNTSLFEIEGIAAPPLTFLDLEKTRKALLLTKYDGGSLHDFIKTDAFNKLTYKEKISGALSLLRGLRFLHVNKLVLHGDIKDRNILVNKEPLKFCLADFGGSINLSDGSVLNNIIQKKGEIHTTITLSHVAMEDAEVISEARRKMDHELWYDIQLKRDIYAMGIVIFKLLAGSHPYNDLPTKKAEPAADVDQIPPEVPVAIREQIIRMIQPDFNQREGSIEHIISIFEKELNNI